MQVSVEKISNVERRLTISVPAEQLEQAYNKQISQLAKKSKIKGFRPGKAPLTVIQQQYGPEAQREALNEVIQKAYYEAITEQALKPVSAPQIEPKIKGMNEPLEFTASFEVMPEIAEVKLAMDQVEKITVDVTDEDVDRVIEQLRKQYSKWTPVERGAEKGDRVVIDYYAIFDGKEDKENTVRDYPLELGSASMLPGFEDGLLGAKPGEEKHLKLEFPKDFVMEERAGKPVEFIITVKKVFDAEIPELNEDFVKKLAIKSGNVDELKQEIKKSLENERDRLVQDKLKEQVFTKLLDQNPIEVPPSMVAREAQQIHNEIYPHHKHDTDHHHSDEETTQMHDAAQKRVKLGLLVSEFAKQSELKASEERVSKRIEEIASSYERPDEVISWLSTKEQRAGIEAQVMEEQIVDKLIEGVTILEKKMSYSELKGIRV